MYPDEIVFGMTLYDIFILIGVIAAFFLADRMTVKRGFSVALQRIVIVAAFSCVVVGYASAVFFQALYNIPERGKFIIDGNTGATFLGGLIGGAVTFLLVYFLAGKRFCKDGEELKKFGEITNIGACCVPLAHAFGRIGCLTAGCCHGRETSAWYGITMYAYTTGGGEEVWHRVVPVQLYESAFLFLLAALLIAAFFGKLGGKRRPSLPLLPFYLVAYGVWRFLIEFARGDDRGATFIPFLTPSQFVSLVMIVGGAVWLALYFLKKRNTPPSGLSGRDGEEVFDRRESDSVPSEETFGNE